MKSLIQNIIEVPHEYISFYFKVELHEATPRLGKVVGVGKDAATPSTTLRTNDDIPNVVAESADLAKVEAELVKSHAIKLGQVSHLLAAASFLSCLI